MGSTQASHDVDYNASRGYPKTASSKISIAENHKPDYRGDKVYQLWKAEINGMYLMVKISLSAHLHLKNRYGEYKKSVPAKAWGFLP